MSTRHLPVRPNLDQLRHQAKDLLRAVRRGDADALLEFRTHHPAAANRDAVTLADAQFALARSYGVSSWQRLSVACRLTDAIWRDDGEAVREIIEKQPSLLNEPALARPGSNWGPPMSYAANLGRDRIIRMLYDRGATDLEHALDRAALQGRIDTARMIHEWLGAPRPTSELLGGPAYTLNVAGTRFLLEAGAPVRDTSGAITAPIAVVLESDSRRPQAKHEILELYVERGVDLPDTAPMALHRGRLDLLESHLRRDPALLERTFAHEEIYPPQLGCHDQVLATHGTPLHGATLLHMCVDYDELAIARWLLERGMQADARAAVDADGFGGHTALFATVVSQPAFWMNLWREPPSAPFAELLLEHGADPNARASLRKQLHPGYGDDRPVEYRDVTPLTWGRRFHARQFVNDAAMALIAARGGRD